MDISSYFWNASKSSVVSSSSDSEDGYESEIDVQPNPPKKHCSSSTSKPPSKSGSGIRRYNKKWEETFPWLEFDENMQCAFCKLCKNRRLVGLGLPNLSLEVGDSENEITFIKRSAPSILPIGRGS